MQNANYNQTFMHRLPWTCHMLLTNSLLSVSHLFLLMTRLASATAGSVLAPNNILFLICGARRGLAAVCQLHERRHPCAPVFPAARCISGLAKRLDRRDLKSELPQIHSEAAATAGFSSDRQQRAEGGAGGFSSAPERLWREPERGYTLRISARSRGVT